MTNSFVVQVPVEQADELRKLLVDSGQPKQDVSTSHAFDGDTVVQVILIITSSVIPALASWLNVRAAAHKNSKVLIEGAEYSGYTAEEVKEIIDRLEQAKRERGDE